MKHTVVAVAVLLVAGCGRTNSLKETFLPAYDSLVSLYHTGTAQEAETAMLDQLRLIDRAENEKLAFLDIEKLRFLSFLRLARVYSAQEKTKEADKNMARSIAAFRAAYPSESNKPDTTLLLEFTRLAEGLERETPPKWKMPTR